MISRIRMAEEATRETETLDQGWMALLMEAKSIGLTVEDVQQFLHTKAPAQQFKLMGS